MNKKYTNILLIVLGGVLVFLGVVFLNKKNKPLRELEYFGNRQEDSVLVDGKYKTTVSYHKIKDFAFYNQLGNTITLKDLENKIVVVDYFFTTCKSICPVMTSQMYRVYEHYKPDNTILFLSHTVDPETDSVSVMSEYAKQKNIDASKWHLLTGDKKELYKIARESYYLDAEQGDGGPDDFIHTPNFALIDKEKHIRGFYDGTDSTDVNRLIKDIEILSASYQ